MKDYNNSFSVPAEAGDATARIQRAIDDCFRAGGGVVRIGAGLFTVAPI